MSTEMRDSILGFFGGICFGNPSFYQYEVKIILINYRLKISQIITTMKMLNQCLMLFTNTSVVVSKQYMVNLSQTFSHFRIFNLLLGYLAL